MARKHLFARLVLSGELMEASSGSSLLRRKPRYSHYELLALLDRIVQNRRIDALIVILRNFSAGWAQIEEIRSSLSDLDAQGLQVIAYLEDADNRSYYLSTAASRIVMPPASTLNLVGLRVEMLFFNTLLTQLGIGAELFQVGEYKSAGEIFTRTSMSTESKEMTRSLVSTLQRQLVKGVSSSRGLDESSVQELIDSGPFTAAKAKEKGLIDEIAYEDEIESELESGPVPLVQIAASKLRPPSRLWARLRHPRQNQVALLCAEGMITSGESRRTKGRWPILGAETLVSFLKDARKRKRVKAIVLRVNSPGGSILASDLIWRQVDLTAKEKPVIVSFGSLAASGGYYISVPASRIFASRATLTGSIGVIGGKFNIKGALSRLGVTTDSVQEGTHSGISSSLQPFLEAEKEQLHDQASDFYHNQFLRKVAEGRELEVSDVKAAGQGRVWTGHQALERGLVDEIGGLNEAIEAARTMANLERARFRVMTYRQRRSVLDVFEFPAFQAPPHLRFPAFLGPDLIIR